MANPVVQFQIVAKDPEGVSRFYSSLFGWKVQNDNSLGYRTLTTGSDRGISGGVWPSPPEGHNLLQMFIEVPDIEKYIEKAVSLGAKVIIPRSVLPDGDAMAIVLDPAGLSFGLYSPAS